MNASIRLLANLLLWKDEEIEEVITLKDGYTSLKKKKKDGSFRMINVPAPGLKRFQRRFLKYFLYRIPLDNHGLIKGFCRNSSYIDNAKAHLNRNMKFVLRVDLKDAFPSVKTEHLRAILKKIIFNEMEGYGRKGRKKKKTDSFTALSLKKIALFSMKKVEWFRNVAKGFPQLNLFHDVFKTINDFIELVLSLTTYKGKLPQGAPTSPYLLNIMLHHSGLIEKVYQFLWDKKVFVSDGEFSQVYFSIYADDFTISSSEPIPWSIINELIDLIEKESFFRVNRKKTLYFRRNRIAPLVTGLRLVSLPDSGNQVLSLPKKQVKKIRGLINRATDPLFQEELKGKVDGYMASLKIIYGDRLPRQITVPYKKYKESLKNVC